MTVVHGTELREAIGRLRLFIGRFPERDHDALRQAVVDLAFAAFAAIEEIDGEYCHTWGRDEGDNLYLRQLLKWIDGTEGLPQ